MPTDTKLNNLIINYLTQAQYDAIESPNENELYLTPDNSTGGGGKSVSPCLNLMDMDTGYVRTSITEEEYNNIKKGLYDSVFCIWLNESEDISSISPCRLVDMSGGRASNLIITRLTASAGAISVDSMAVNELVIGEKDSSGNYPFTITEASYIPLGGSIEVIEATKKTSADADGFNYTLSSEPLSDRYILKYKRDGFESYTYVLMLALRKIDQWNNDYSGFCTVSLGGSTYFWCLYSAKGNARITNYSYLPPEITAADDGKAMIASVGNGYELVDFSTIYSKARYKHTITLKTSAGAILWTQTLPNSKNTPVNSYATLKTLFGGELLAGYGEYAQLDLHGGTEATDKLIKLDGTEATLASLGAIVYSDDCFLPK